MKVTSQHNAPSGANAKVNKTAPANDADSGAVEGQAAGLTGEGENFASVLERVTQSHSKSANQHRSEDDHDAEAGRDRDESPAPLETKSWREDETKDAGQPAFVERATPREARAIGEATPPARAILHVADLEKIVAACRTQVAAGGQHEVVIEMSRSVLEGLRVKVSADAGGRITTDFIAVSENVKTLLDARAAELSELLRARGVNLEVVKTSVAADANAQDNARGGRDSDARLRGEAFARAGRTGAAVAGAASEVGRDDAPDGTTYRA